LNWSRNLVAETFLTFMAADICGSRRNVQITL
jgi:hypothetical protein